MPYIKKETRKRLDTYINELVQHMALIDAGVGELNYVITRIALGMKPERYADMNGIVGALECAKMEFYRRKAVPYEDKKIAENGDVPGYEYIDRNISPKSC